jgi:SAM-dependent methyltransferase
MSESGGARAVRERAYWDEVYGGDGPEHRKYAWTVRLEEVSHIGERFRGRVRDVRGQRVLCLGGGVDRLAVSLASMGNQVVTLDVSPVAAAATGDLARDAGASAALVARSGRAEDLRLDGPPFDLVLCRRALHHMNVETVIARVHDVLRPEGVFLAEEPVCLSGLLRWIHRALPFHPESPRTADERELTERDLALLRDTFGRVTVSYFDLLTRESLAYVFDKAGGRRLLKPLGRLDELVVNRHLPFLKRLSTYAIIEATR